MVSQARAPLGLSASRPAQAARVVKPDRLTALFHDHFDAIWRLVRRLGVPDGAIDDAAQEVFVVASRRLEIIEAGKEKAFLYGTAVRVAADARRSRDRRREAPGVDAPDVADPAIPTPEDLVDQKRARELLDVLIARLPDDTRPVFVLYELEGMTMAEIAVCLDLAPGTVASRLRRARETFQAQVARLDAARKGA